MPLRTLRSIAIFGGQFLSNPKPVGSVMPSSRALGRRMASFIPMESPGLILELGAGTGAITASLLKKGIPADQLVAIDCSAAMVRRLQEQFPQVRCLVGDAGRLEQLMDQHFDLRTVRVSHVVSSIPLRLLQDGEVRTIAREIVRVLKTGGRFIQYTYDIRPTPQPGLSDFEFLGSSLVWFNVPPARVNVYQVPAAN